jgi:hypothetical protein
MTGKDDEVDFDKLVAKMSEAVRLQARSALHHTLVAGTMSGLHTQAVAEKLSTFAAAELEDTRHLIEKAYALDCMPAVEVAAITAVEDVHKALTELRDAEVEVLRALHAVIPETGQEFWSEALEHLLEHIIMRKQHQVDYLDRVLG